MLVISGEYVWLGTGFKAGFEVHVYLGCVNSVVDHNSTLTRAHLIAKVILLVSLFGGLDLGLDCGTGLRESCTHNFVWLKQHRKYTASTYQVRKFQLQHRCYFGANLCMIVLYNLWPNVEFGGMYSIDRILSYTRWCNQVWNMRLLELFLCCFQLFCWHYKYGFSSPDRLSALSLGTNLK